MPGRLVFVQAITTGPNPRLDHLLEVAVVVVDEKLVEVAGLAMIINPALGRHGAQWKERLDDQSRHTLANSGLLREIEFAVSPASAEEALRAVLKPYESGDLFISAGYAPMQTMTFLSDQMSSVARMFRLDVALDVASVRLVIERLAGRSDLIPDIGQRRSGRAMEDLQDAVSEARIYTGYLGLLPRWA
jgi:oligoribonuclease (3'-5' exoribonuclease)